MVSEFFTFHHSAFHGSDAGFLHGNKGQVGGDRRGKMQRRPHAQVVGHALQPLEEIQPQEPDAADEREDKNGQNDRCAFEWFELHRAQLNKKPEQLKVALVLIARLSNASQGCP